jgi:hypothetical protein
VAAILAVVTAAVIPGVAHAAINYGGGYYTNLCDSGTSATFYNCDSRCSPQTGSCTGENDGVVKWVCRGKWNQCLESESQWSNYEEVKSESCGNTVQLSLFDKKCRRQDGSWDASCKLLGYMTWYSGDCYEGETGVTGQTGVIVATQTPTSVPTTTPKLTATPSPTLASKMAKSTSTPTPTNIPAPGMCGKTCKLAGDCRVGFACFDGVCRNPACPADKGCFCQITETASGAAKLAKTPETGVETWLGMAAMAGLGVAGLKLRRAARRLW